MNPIQTLLAAKGPKPKAFVGFDGYVDSLYRVIKSRDGAVKTPYADIPEFAAELASRAGKSGGLALDRISVRLGGNAPLMAMGLSALGAEVSCCAAMGLPELHPAYQPLADLGASLISCGDTAQTWALEFDDGKFMLNDSAPFEALDWMSLRRAVKLDELQKKLREAELIALVDWANMPLATDLWRGLLEEGLGKPQGAPKKIFFDLADITRPSAEELKALLPVLKGFKAHGPVVLGLNENEALKLGAKLGIEAPSLELLGEKLLAATELTRLVIHPRDRAIIIDTAGVQSVPGRLVAKPLISTGGGDHFNAGYCLGWLKGLDPGDCARAATGVSGLYVGGGRSPKLDELISSF